MSTATINSTSQGRGDWRFNDSIIIPSLELTTRQDTLWKDSLTIDTIRTVAYTRYFPDDIELRLFKEDFVRQYLLKPERQQENLLTIRFNAPLDTVPLPKPLNFTPENPDWFFTQETEAGKGVNFWLTDSLVWKQDTLQVELSYPKSDSLNVLRPQTDTLQFVMRRRPEKKKKKKDDEPEPDRLPGYADRRARFDGLVRYRIRYVQ